ncbi:MAG TPA: cyclodeaminase/cyclohydrolase family protein [Streptosporangiaceae bacterium]
MTDPLGLPVGEFLSRLAGPEPAPSGGGAAALAVSMAAGLCAMTARLSARQLTGAEDLATAAQRTADRAASLIQADADSYAAVIDAQRRKHDDDQSRRREIAAALAAAADVPMEIVELAVPVARLAARLAADGNPNLRGDAIAGALLAEAGARAAAILVGINLAGTDDGRPARAEQLAKEAAFAAEATAQK